MGWSVKSLRCCVRMRRAQLYTRTRSRVHAQIAQNTPRACREPRSCANSCPPLDGKLARLRASRVAFLVDLPGMASI
eukprot:scaffold9268_cov125-Isochrysis_galbana.AAC.4